MLAELHNAIRYVPLDSWVCPRQTLSKGSIKSIAVKIKQKTRSAVLYSERTWTGLDIDFYMKYIFSLYFSHLNASPSSSL